MIVKFHFALAHISVEEQERRRIEREAELKADRERRAAEKAAREEAERLRQVRATGYVRPTMGSKQHIVIYLVYSCGQLFHAVLQCICGQSIRSSDFLSC